ncbi:MAG: hypothetical protein HC897_00475 [Thermoanaerobaculia bacterium]|nr:hypothetical protein [Thermoanaerobaculia bacterium]
MSEETKKNTEIENLNPEAVDVDALSVEDLEDVSGGGCTDFTGSCSGFSGTCIGFHNPPAEQSIE